MYIPSLSSCLVIAEEEELAEDEELAVVGMYKDDGPNKDEDEGVDRMGLVVFCLPC
jgi:hypothetical protein